MNYELNVVPLHSEMQQTFKEIKEQLARRILILDGAMGTRIQAFGLSAESFHRGKFASWPVSLVGNNDILSITAPDVIKQIHQLYIEAGADIIATNTFSSNRISQQEYGCSDIAAEMAREGARLARLAADGQTLSNSPLKKDLRCRLHGPHVEIADTAVRHEPAGTSHRFLR